MSVAWETYVPTRGIGRTVDYSVPFARINKSSLMLSTGAVELLELDPEKEAKVNVRFGRDDDGSSVIAITRKAIKENGKEIKPQMKLQFKDNGTASFGVSGFNSKFEPTKGKYDVTESKGVIYLTHVSSEEEEPAEFDAEDETTDNGADAEEAREEDNEEEPEPTPKSKRKR